MNLREWALPVYTILMQLSVGMQLIFWLIRAPLQKRLSSLDVDLIFRKPFLLVFITPLVAMVGSHFHLSNPWISFLAILNVGKSWLSREIFLSVLFFITAGVQFYVTWFLPGEKQRLKTILGWGGVALGVISVFAMSMCYLIPAQPAWDHPFTMLLFYCSALILGAVSAFTILFMDAIFAAEYEPALTSERHAILKRHSFRLAVLILVTLALIVGMNLTRILGYQRLAPINTVAQTTLSLLLGLYRPLLVVRFASLFIGAGLFLLVTYRLVKQNQPLKDLVVPTYLSCFLLLVAEILGRFLFYAAHIRLGL